MPHIKAVTYSGVLGPHEGLHLGVPVGHQRVYIYALRCESVKAWLEPFLLHTVT